MEKRLKTTFFFDSSKIAENDINEGAVHYSLLLKPSVIHWNNDELITSTPFTQEDLKLSIPKKLKNTLIIRNKHKP